MPQIIGGILGFLVLLVLTALGAHFTEWGGGLTVLAGAVGGGLGAIRADARRGR